MARCSVGRPGTRAGGGWPGAGWRYCRTKRRRWPACRSSKAAVVRRRLRTDRSVTVTRAKNSRALRANSSNSPWPVVSRNRRAFAHAQLDGEAGIQRVKRPGQRRQLGAGGNASAAAPVPSGGGAVRRSKRSRWAALQQRESWRRAGLAVELHLQRRDAGEEAARVAREQLGLCPVAVRTAAIAHVDREVGVQRVVGWASPAAGLRARRGPDRWTVWRSGTAGPAGAAPVSFTGRAGVGQHQRGTHLLRVEPHTRWKSRRWRRRGAVAVAAHRRVQPARPICTLISAARGQGWAKAASSGVDSRFVAWRSAKRASDRAELTSARRRPWSGNVRVGAMAAVLASCPLQARAVVAPGERQKPVESAPAGRPAYAAAFRGAWRARASVARAGRSPDCCGTQVWSRGRSARQRSTNASSDSSP